MPRRILSEEEKKVKTKQKIYAKILDGNALSISDLAKLLNKKSATIRTWELKGIIPKARKNEQTNHREYNQSDLLVVLQNIMKYSWERNCLNKEELEKIIHYLSLAESTKY
jgi:DNA-binding transcriptional MerR regulator